MDREVRVDPSALPLGAPMPAPGDVIEGKYRLDAVLGRGGMSVIYRATHLHLDQPVAIKILSAASLALPEYLVRLEREARTASRIRSEHVVRVFDIGRLPGSGIPYLVMEYLHGADLAAVLARDGRLSVELAVDAIVQVCEALAEAHALGIIHRDLKPANLFLTESVDGAPCVKVLDFGISRMLHRSKQLTDPGTVLGTPSYMAPEQMEANERVDARSDIWALGTILFELLVGRPAWSGESLTRIFVKIMRTETPRPSRFRKDVPFALDRVVARCLAIDPSDRYQSVAELARALAPFGSRRARESAERTSRVWEKRRAESGVAAVLPPRMELVTARRRLVGQVATALVAGIGVAFGVLALDRAPSAEADVPEPRVHVEDDAAVLFTPIVRPPQQAAGVVVPHDDPERPPASDADR